MDGSSMHRLMSTMGRAMNDASCIRAYAASIIHCIGLVAHEQCISRSSCTSRCSASAATTAEAALGTVTLATAELLVPHYEGSGHDPLDY